MHAQLEGAAAPNLVSLHPRLSAVPILVEAVLGSQKLAVREIAAWQPGSIIATDRRAGGPIEIRVNSVPIALGDVRLQDHRLSVQITELRLED